MDISNTIDGSHATVSPGGQLIAYIANKLRIGYTEAPERYTEFSIRIASKDVVGLRWSADSAKVAIVSSKYIEVTDLEDDSLRVRLDNGAGGWGRFFSADFVTNSRLLVVWEFGKARIWNLQTGKGVDVAEVKLRGSGTAWQMRPENNDKPATLAVLSRPSAEDMLELHFPDNELSMPLPRLRGIDIRSVSWSPDGRWLATVDAPYSDPCVHLYTADGNHYKSFEDARESVTDRQPSETGVKEVQWSSNGRFLALSKYNGSITLLNTRTFSPVAIIEHATIINQATVPVEEQARVWQEAVSAAGERSYALKAQPASPPRSEEHKTSDGSIARGVAESCFSCDGAYLATRDERMLSTVWIWDMRNMSTHAVLIQHSNVRKMHWHLTRPEMLMLDCGEGVAYLFDVGSSRPPVPLAVPTPGMAALSWLPTAQDARIAILAASKSTFRLLHPEGRDTTVTDGSNLAQAHTEATFFEEGASEDSLMDALSSRKPAAPWSQQSHTERLEAEGDAELGLDISGGLEDTFREKRRPAVEAGDIDPLDDSQIF